MIEAASNNRTSEARGSVWPSCAAGLMRIASILLLLACMHGAVHAQTFQYSETFTQGVTYNGGTAQHDNWANFRASLPTSGVTSITVRGSRDATGRTCNDPALAQQIADAMRAGATGIATSTVTMSVNCGGFNWQTGSCSVNSNSPNNLELNVGSSTTVCVCSSTQYILRPGILNLNWGGIAGTTCNAVTQTMTVLVRALLPSTTTITSDLPDPSFLGQSYPVNVTVTGAGATPTGTVIVTDDVGNSCSITLAGGTGSCGLPGTQVGSRVLTASYGGDTTYMTSGDTESHTIVEPSDMEPDVSGLPAVAEVGVAYSGTVLCTNNGPASADQATCAVTGLPAGLSVDACVPLPPATLVAGASITCTVSGTPAASGTVSILATTGAQNDNNGGTSTGGNNQAAITLTAHQSSIATTKTAVVDISGGLSAALGDAGDSITYTISVENTGTSTLTGVTVTDTLTRIGGGALTLDAPPSPASVASLAPGTTATFTATYTLFQADIDAGGVSNVASASASPPAGPAIGDAVDAPVVTTIAPAPSLSITKTADDATLRAVNDVITYTYVVTNTGNVTINDVTITDTHNGSGPPPVPANEVLVTDITGQSSDATANNGTWSVLRPGDAVRFTASYAVTQSDVDLLQ